MSIRKLIRPGLTIIILVLALLTSVSAIPLQAHVAAAPAAIADPETIHIVQRGDTLYSIARRYGVTVQALMAYNSLTSTTIYVGQRLLIPGGGPGTGNPVIYVVQRGDTLYSIARRYGATVDAIMRANRLSSTWIYVGQRLTIPVATPPPMTIHVVQRGDTLYSIARRYGTTVTAIQAANRLRSTTIYVGQRLLIPTRPGYPGEPTPGPTPGAPLRIEFPPGATSATVAGRTVPNNPQRYLVRALQGQTMTVYLSTAGEASYIAVLNPWGENMAGAGGPIHQWSGVLPVTGDYTIEVRATRAAAADFYLTVTVSPLGTQPPTPGPIQQAGEAMVESVQVQILESYPVQVQATVRGQLPDACTYIASVTQQREGTTLRIQLATARNPNQLCAQVLTPFEQVVRLDVAGLPPGNYNVRVNEVSAPFQLPG